MPCKLQRTGPNEFESATGATVDLFVESGSGTVHITAAFNNDAPVPLEPNGHVILKNLPAGLSIVRLAFTASDPDEEFPIKEDCGGNSQVLEKWRLQQGPNGEPGGPTKRLRINAKP